MMYVEQTRGLVIVVTNIWRCVPACHKISIAMVLLVFGHYIAEKRLFII
jgi:hypothetical protein